MSFSSNPNWKIDDNAALELPEIYDLSPSCAFRLTADIDFDTVSSPSPSKSDASDPDDIGVHIISTARLPQMCTNVSLANISSNSSVAEDDELGDGLRTGPPSLTKNQQQLDSGPSSLVTQAPQSSPLARASSLTWVPGQAERRRRKLPEIPKTKKSKSTGFPSLTASFQLFIFNLRSSNFVASFQSAKLIGRRVGQHDQHFKPAAVQAELVACVQVLVFAGRRLEPRLGPDAQLGRR